MLERQLDVRRRRLFAGDHGVDQLVELGILPALVTTQLSLLLLLLFLTFVLRVRGGCHQSCEKEPIDQGKSATETHLDILL
jgi:hypothetical protein